MPGLPTTEVLVIDRHGPELVRQRDASPERVGEKAAHLVGLPPEWVPGFFVVSSSGLSREFSNKTLADWCASGMERCGFNDRPLIVRSSGVTEGLADRGRFVSEECESRNLIDTLRRTASTVATGPRIAKVHWIVQERVPTEKRGHLSNERRVSYEPRDWVAEIEVDGDHAAYTVPVAVRRWRDGDAVQTSALVCSSEPQIGLLLKKVALWAIGVSRQRRMHFEWVWSGSRLYVVQADVVGESSGVDPTALMPQSVANVDVGALSVFQVAEDRHYETYAKLANAHLYTSLGYKMPTFYVLDDSETMAQILRGTECPRLDNDLAKLTEEPLVIRTDGCAIPSHRREMLPRSDELRTLSDAKTWLAGQFRASIEEGGLQWVRLFLVDGSETSRRGCEQQGKSYLTRRRRAEEGDGGGSLTGGAIPSA